MQSSLKRWVVSGPKTYYWIRGRGYKLAASGKRGLLTKESDVLFLLREQHLLELAVAELAVTVLVIAAHQQVEAFEGLGESEGVQPRFQLVKGDRAPRLHVKEPKRVLDRVVCLDAQLGLFLVAPHLQLHLPFEERHQLLAFLII